MPTHMLLVSPAPRKSGGVLPGKFDARLGDRSIVEASRTPFCDGARALLAQGLAAPGDLLVMRHTGSQHDALRAMVGVAARLTVDETSGNGTPRFVRWKPMPRITSEGASPMRETDPQAIPLVPPSGSRDSVVREGTKVV
jgi:hypothetical protein